MQIPVHNKFKRKHKFLFGNQSPIELIKLTFFFLIDMPDPPSFDINFIGFFAIIVTFSVDL